MSLPAPKRLNNPFEARSQAALAAQSTPAPRPMGSGGKLTWSERQALAKKRAEEEEANSRASAAQPVTRAAPPSSASRWGTTAAVGGAAIGAATVVSTASAAQDPEPEEAFAVCALTRFSHWIGVERDSRTASASTSASTASSDDASTYRTGARS